jgi:hypothetical protein
MRIPFVRLLCWSLVLAVAGQRRIRTGLPRLHVVRFTNDVPKQKFCALADLPGLRKV